ncbi:MAG: cysteine--tRNA ligase [Elusimicrobiota bacterium]|jgi:cysteinyl-tRNA synthetase|nr:cysteine--tRNA ligase [Elusimicrobiota bacterium]
MPRFYNTLTKKKEDFVPLVAGETTIYTCGPTVYNYAHIGNLRTYIFEDILVRTLRKHYKVTHVMNITDVGHLTSDCDTGEDKMEVSSKREGGISASELAKRYECKFFEDFNALNCMYPSFTPHATEHIREMIELIKILEKKGFTYKTSDGIYYDTSKFPSYGALAGKSHIEGLKAGSRIDFSGEKRHTSDFALWKFSPKDCKRQMEWPSPWGICFPGWHIECSAMSMKYLGDTLDIHCGGADHIAIHHTNEIAQSEAATGKPYVRMWIHGEFLILSSGKMSKSSGTFLTLDALRQKGYDPLDYRYLCLGAHYRTQLEFSFDSLDFAKNTLRNLKEKIALFKKQRDGVIKDARALENVKADFQACAEDDINTPKALSVLWDFIKSPAAAEDKLAFVKYADSFLGLSLMKEEAARGLPADAAALIAEREKARKNKDFITSDNLRAELEKMRIIVKDTPAGTEWSWK